MDESFSTDSHPFCQTIAQLPGDCSVSDQCDSGGERNVFGFGKSAGKGLGLFGKEPSGEDGAGAVPDDVHHDPNDGDPQGGPEGDDITSDVIEEIKARLAAGLIDPADLAGLDGAEDDPDPEDDPDLHAGDTTDPDPGGPGGELFDIDDDLMNRLFLAVEDRALEDPIDDEDDLDDDDFGIF